MMPKRNTTKKRVFAVAILLLAVGGVAHGRGENKELFVVPVPGAVAIDGALEDWDLSAYVNSYVIPETRETQSARLAMMYDADALYISGVVRDASPMMNRHDPQTSPTKAWDADVCQILLSLDPDAVQPLKFTSFNPAHKEVDVATLFLWHFTDRQEPALAMYRGMSFTKPLRADLDGNGHVPAGNFEAAYRKGDDGLGYTFEYRLPWKTLNMKRVPAAGDKLASAMAVFWSTPDGLKTAGGAAWAWNIMSKSGFAFQASDCWGTLVFLQEGNIARERVTGHLPPEKPLPLTFRYTLPREGQATVQLFNEKQESVRILLAQQQRPEGVNTERWDGLDDQGVPLPEGRYSWRGQVSDPIRAEYRFSVHNSGQPPYPTDDNKGGWGGDHGVPTAALALTNGMILSWNGAEYGWGTIRTDAEGKKIWGTKYTAEHLATDGKRLFLAMSGGHSFADSAGVSVLDLADSRPMNFQPGMPALRPPEGGEKGASAVTGLACDGNRIYVAYGRRDLVAVYTHDGTLEAQWPVPAPGRMAVGADGLVLVISGGQVRKLGTQDSEIIISGQLDQPQSIAAGADGTIYVANRGTRQDVSVFDAAGHYLHGIGKAGGRPATGRYDASGMFQPGGIAVDAAGRLWVAEVADGPKRISVWDSRTGSNLKEFFGGSDYFGYGYIDPARPDEFYAHHVIWKIDWKGLKAEPQTTFWRKTQPDMIEGCNPCGHNHGLPLRVLTASNGRQYMWGNTKRHKTVLQRRDGELYRPFAAIMHIDRGWSLYQMQGLPEMDDDPDTYKRGRYLWQDDNEDQLVQGSEITRLSSEFGSAWFIWMDPDLSVFLSSGHVLRPVRITDGGRPVYDIAQAVKAPMDTGNYGWRDPAGFCYRFSSGTMMKRGADGKEVWRYGGIKNWHDSLALPIAGPGRLWGMTGPMGVAGDYFAMMSYFGPNHIFTRDGGYVAAVLEDGRLGYRGANAGQPEGQGGQFVRLKIDGRERYFIIHGGQDSRVWEVLGLDSVQPLSGGVYEYTTEMAGIARREREVWEAAKAGRARLVLKRGLDSLDAVAAVGKTLEGGRGFEARMAYDGKNLYVRYDVTGSNALANAITEDALLFRGGNCLDLQLATDPAADPARKTPAPGDLRLLVSRRDGKPFAMLYRPKVAGFKGEPTVLRSPTGTESFERIEMTDRVGLEYSKTATGFTAVVTVPLDLLGWTPKAGSTVRMDVGYIFGNGPGTRAAIRAYWSNNSFAANVVDDVPHESRLEPAEWSDASVE